MTSDAALAKTLPLHPSMRAEAAHWLVDRHSLEPFRDRTGPHRGERALWSVVEALFATADGAPPPSRVAWVCADVEDFFVRAGPRARMVYRLSLWFCMWLAPLLAGRWGTLASLAVPLRSDVLDRLERGPIWQTGPLLAIKAIATLVYYEHPDVADEVGFDGECKVTK